MEGEIPPVCSACGAELGHPDNEVEHPEDDDPPEDAHFKVQIREQDDGERLQCKETGQLAQVISPDSEKHPANEGVPEGGRDEGQRSQSGGREEPQVYDLPEEKDQMDILKDVITNPHYQLEDNQIQEVRAWAQDMNGQLPPDTLESMLKNFNGVQKQTAELVRQRYELKLNNWMREQSSRDEGPPIGISSPAPMPSPNQGGQPRRQRGNQPRPQHATPTPDTPENSGNQSREEESLSGQEEQDRDVGGLPGDGIRTRRRARRTKRRNDAADIAAEEMAKKVAPEVAREFTQNFGRYFGLPAKIIEAKVEKDPDWALEKLDKLGLDLDDILEPSEARKKEMREEEERNRQSKVDHEVDDVLDQVSGGTREQPEPEPQPTPNEQPQQDENNKSPGYEERDERPMSASPHDEPPEDEGGEEMFDDIFSGEEEEH